MRLKELTVDLKTSFPRLDWSETGLLRLNEVLQLLEDPKHDPDVLKQVEDQFIKQLQYLNDYGGESYRVKLSSDWGTLNFGLTWAKPDLVKPELVFYGGLQFDGVPQPFGSVNLTDDQGYWSIHT